MRKMNLGGDAVVLDGERAYVQSKRTLRKTRINYEEGQCVMHLRLQSKQEEVREETENVLKGSRFAILATENEEVSTRQV